MERDRKNYRKVQPISICGDKLSYRKKKKPVTAINILVRFQVYSVSDARRRRAVQVNVPIAFYCV